MKSIIGLVSTQGHCDVLDRFRLEIMLVFNVLHVVVLSKLWTILIHYNIIVLMENRDLIKNLILSSNSIKWLSGISFV
jgi:hypothetical protein